MARTPQPLLPWSCSTQPWHSLRWRLSRRAVEATAGAAHSESDVVVDSERPITVQLIGKSNAKVLAPDNDVFELPSGTG